MSIFVRQLEAITCEAKFDRHGNWIVSAIAWNTFGFFSSVPAPLLLNFSSVWDFWSSISRTSEQTKDETSSEEKEHKRLAEQKVSSRGLYTVRNVSLFPPSSVLTLSCFTFQDTTLERFELFSWQRRGARLEIWNMMWMQGKMKIGWCNSDWVFQRNRHAFKFFSFKRGCQKGFKTFHPLHRNGVQIDLVIFPSWQLGVLNSS